MTQDQTQVLFIPEEGNYGMSDSESGGKYQCCELGEGRGTIAPLQYAETGSKKSTICL